MRGISRRGTGKSLISTVFPLFLCAEKKKGERIKDEQGDCPKKVQRIRRTPGLQPRDLVPPLRFGHREIKAEGRGEEENPKREIKGTEERGG